MQTFKVDGMTCGHCERAVTEAIQALDPAAKVQVDLQEGTVTTDSNVAPEKVEAAIIEEGYQARRVEA